MRRPRQHGAADDDHVIRRFLAQLGADLFGDALEICQVEAAVLSTGCSDADEGDLGIGDGVCRVRRAAKTSGSDAAGEKVVEPRFDDRTFAGVDRRDLVRVHIDTDNVMTIGRERGRRNASDVA